MEFSEVDFFKIFIANEGIHKRHSKREDSLASICHLLKVDDLDSNQKTVTNNIWRKYTKLREKNLDKESILSTAFIEKINNSNLLLISFPSFPIVQVSSLF